MRSRRRVAMVVTAVAFGSVLATSPSGAGASLADEYTAAPTGVSAAFLSWHDGLDRMRVSWDAPTSPVDHYLVRVVGGADPGGAEFAVAGDQTSADLDVATAANPVLHNQLIVTVTAWGVGGQTPSEPSTPTATPSVLGAALAGGIQSGVAGQGRISWPAPAPGDVLILRQQSASGGDPFTTGLPVPIVDPTSAGSLVAPTDSTGRTAVFALYEQVAGDPAQRSPASLAQGQAAPSAVAGVVATYAEDGRSMQVSWGLPPSCPPVVLATHCLVARVAVAEGLVAPTSPTDGVALAPADGQPGIENFSATITGLHPGRTYTVAVFNTTAAGPAGYSPAVALPPMPDLLKPGLTFTGDPVATVTYGSKVRLRFTATGWDGVTPLAGSPISVLGAGRTLDLGVVDSGVTSARGRFTASFRPRFTATYRARTPQTATYAAGASSPDDPVVHVRPVLSLSAGERAVRAGAVISLRGRLAPHLATRVVLERHTSAGWRTVQAGTASKTGVYRFSVHPKVKGSRTFRVRRVGDALLLAGVSPTVRVTVDVRVRTARA